MKILMRILVVTLMLAILCSIGFGIAYKKITEKYVQQISSLAISDIDVSSLTDGCYIGEYKVFPIDVEVKVTVENKRINNVEITRHSNGRGTPAEQITDKVIAAQSLKVDVVAGATGSSKVI